MSKIEIVNHQISGEMEYTNPDYPAREVSCSFCEILAAAQAVHNIDPVGSLLWELKLAGYYDFIVIMADAREWRQTIRGDDGGIWMTYDVSDEFSTKPMEAARELRKRLIKESAKYNVSRVELTWL